MHSFRNLIFDLDGTLTNPQQGILHSLRYALSQLNYDNLPDFVPAGFIGPPIQQCFKNVYHLNDRDTERAIAYFREYYGTKGLYENYPYDGILEMLSVLYDNGKSMFIATSKYMKYAWEIARYFEIDKYIIDLAGADYKGSKYKADLIKDLILRYRLRTDESLMIGDTLFDIEGARDTGISILSVGYGFTTTEMLLEGNPDFYAKTVEDLAEKLIG